LHLRNKLLEKKFGYDLLVEYWDGESELKAVVDECYEKSKEVVKDEIDEILKYVGLK